MNKFIKWPDIEAFHHVRKSVRQYPYLLQDNPIIIYRAKNKCDGSNLGIQLRDGECLVQSRSRFITPEKDNLGAAAWVESTKDFWMEIYNKDKVNRVIFGEWAGPGIQKRCAISQIPNKVFAIFAIQIIKQNLEDDSELIVDPDKIAEIVPENKEKGIYIIPWMAGDPLEVDWSMPAEILQDKADQINKLVEEVEKCDPFVKEKFGVEGLGEGLVYYPVSRPGRFAFKVFCFKAKGDKHKVVNQSKPAQLDPEVAADVDKFVDLVATEARLEQGVMAVNGGKLEFETRHIGPFLGWVCADIKKECQDELEASKLDWKVVGKVLTTRIRTWFVEKLRNS